MKNIFLLDVDETLLDFKRGEREQLTRALTEAGVSVNGEICARFHEINEGLWKKLERGEMTRQRLVVERFKILLDEIGFHANAKEISENYIAGMQNAAYRLDGAEEFLRMLSERGRIFYVTNGSRRVQTSRLRLSGIGSYAEGVFISEEVGADKPSLYYAQFVEAHIADYDRARAVWLGDSMTSDMLCAQGAGIDFILYAPHGAPQGYKGFFARTYEEALKLIGTL